MLQVPHFIRDRLLFQCHLVLGRLAVQCKQCFSSEFQLLVLVGGLRGTASRRYTYLLQKSNTWVKPVVILVLLLPRPTTTGCYPLSGCHPHLPPVDPGRPHTHTPNLQRPYDKGLRTAKKHPFWFHCELESFPQRVFMPSKGIKSRRHSVGLLRALKFHFQFSPWNKFTRFPLRFREAGLAEGREGCELIGSLAGFLLNSLGDVNQNQCDMNQRCQWNTLLESTLCMETWSRWRPWWEERVSFFPHCGPELKSSLFPCML